MAQITTTLPIEFSGNNASYPYTREKDILEMSVQASSLNILPYSVQKEKCFCDYDGLMERRGRIFHYDFNNLPYTYYKPLLGVNLSEIYDSANAGNIYRMIYRFSNVYHNRKDNATLTFNVEIRNHKNVSITENVISGNSWKFVNNNDGLFETVFILTPETKSINIIGPNYVQAFNGGFDLEVIGIYRVNEEESIINLEDFRGQINFSSTSKISISDTNTILGDYEISRKIRRHIDQMERKLISLYNVYEKINWR